MAPIHERPGTGPDRGPLKPCLAIQSALFSQDCDSNLGTITVCHQPEADMSQLGGVRPRNSKEVVSKTG